MRRTNPTAIGGMGITDQSGSSLLLGVVIMAVVGMVLFSLNKCSQNKWEEAAIPAKADFRRKILRSINRGIDCKRTVVTNHLHIGDTNASWCGPASTQNIVPYDSTDADIRSGLPSTHEARLRCLRRSLKGSARGLTWYAYEFSVELRDVSASNWSNLTTANDPIWCWYGI